MRSVATRRNRWRALTAAAAFAALPAGVCVPLRSAAVAAADAAAGPAAPAAADRTVSVTGTGVVKGKPTVVEFTGVVSGEAELAADAIVKYRDTKRRALKAIEGLKLAGLTVTSKGFAVNQAADPNVQQMLMRGQTPTGVKQSVSVTEQVQLTLTGADKLSDEELMNTVLKVIDTAKDAGLAIGPGTPRSYQQMMIMAQTGQGGAGLATFKLPNANALRAQAYERSMADAKAKAAHLAELAGAKLGKVVSVKEGAAAGENGGNAVAMAYRAMMGAAEGKADGGEAELSSDVFGEIPLAVTLSVQFALE